MYTPLATEMLCPDGDVVLVVGPQHVRMRVHSNALVLHPQSSVPCSLLNVVKRNPPREVQLEGDDAEVIRTICHILHRQNDQVPPILTPLQVLRMALASYKYHLTVALNYVIPHWLRNEEGGLSMIETGYLMIAAFLFDDAEMCKAYSLGLMTNYNSTTRLSTGC